MPVEVILNVYDLMEQTPICCGFFHTGVQVLNVEYSFAGGAGVYDCSPKSAPDGRFREAIVLGTVESSAVARSALDRLRVDFHGDSYSLIFKNCNDFSSAYVRALLGRDIPGYINRLAKLGRSWPIRVFLPPHLKAGASGSPVVNAPLLSQPASRPVFQGSGRSLRTDSTDSNEAQASPGLFSRLSISFRRAFSRNPGNPDSQRALIQGDTNARELRAAAASRRLDGTIDV